MKEGRCYSFNDIDFFSEISLTYSRATCWVVWSQSELHWIEHRIFVKVFSSLILQLFASNFELQLMSLVWDFLVLCFYDRRDKCVFRRPGGFPSVGDFIRKHNGSARTYMQYFRAQGGIFNGPIGLFSISKSVSWPGESWRYLLGKRKNPQVVKDRASLQYNLQLLNING